MGPPERRRRASLVGGGGLCGVLHCGVAEQTLKSVGGAINFYQTPHQQPKLIKYQQYTITAPHTNTYILSNNNQNILKTITKNFTSNFNHILSSKNTDKYKPHPSIYNLPTKLLDITKTNILHMTNNPNNITLT